MIVSFKTYFLVLVIALSCTVPQRVRAGASPPSAGAHGTTAQTALGTPLDFSVFLGGSGLNGLEPARAVTVDSAGSIYVAGEVASSDFPTTAQSLDRQLSGFSDGFVTKLSPDGKRILFSTYLGGSDADLVNAIAVDATGAVYVCGETASPDFPTTSGALDTMGDGRSAFVCKLTADGRELVYSTFLEGEGDGSKATAIAVDSEGHAFVGGSTIDLGFPVIVGAFDTQAGGGRVGFVLKLNADGRTLQYGTFIGGSVHSEVAALAIDANGFATVAGTTSSEDFPTVGALDDVKSGGSDAFVARFNPAGSGLVFSTFVGGSVGEFATGIDMDVHGSVYVTGSTTSTDFPTTEGAFDETRNAASESFVLKMSADGQELVYSSFLGGNSADVTRGIAVDELGSAYVTGSTGSTDFPTSENAVRRTLAGDLDTFVTRINASGSQLEYSTYLGGSDQENPYGVAIDTNGGVYVCGESSSPDFPDEGFGPHDADDAFVARLQIAPLVFEVTGCSPDFALRRQKVDVVVRGSLFEVGAAASFGEGVKVRSVVVESPFTIRVSLKVKKNAAPGMRDVVITNPTGVTTRGEALFEIR